MKEIKNILLITQEYPADDLSKVFTPVVHFFTKEWVKLGYNVKVVNCPSNFPSYVYTFCRPFKKVLESYFNTPIRMYTIGTREYEYDGVSVLRYPLSKNKPHARFKRSQIEKAVKATFDFCDKDSFKPDVILGHWVNPVLEIQIALKKIYNVPIALVFHDAGNEFASIYKNEYQSMLANIDVIGYRSAAIKARFEALYGKKKQWFYCYSGVPKEYINCTSNGGKDFTKVNNFAFVGALSKSKHPNELVEALYKSDISDFNIDIVGSGNEAKSISKTVNKYNNSLGKVNLIGRVPRERVQGYLKKSQVFAMISAPEAFGLVYLEAMANGCITIGSRNQGIDGIIVDGVNGFLCEAGNVKELTQIINTISRMSVEHREAISKNAIDTALKMTDTNVAKNYIDEVIRYL